NLGEEGYDARAELAQVAGKFIGSGQVLEFAAAGEDVETELGEGVEKLVKSSADQGRGLLRIEAGAGRKGREQRPDRELDFLFREPADIVGKGSDVVQFGKEH